MRVAFVTHNFPRHEGDVPGNFLLPLARALRARGHDVRVIAPSDAGKGGAGELAGVPVRRVRYAPAALETIAYTGSMHRAIRTPGGWAALAGLWRALRRAAREEMADGAQLVHAHWWVPGGLAVPKEVPFVLTVHGTDMALLNSSGVARRLARPVFARARVVTAVSHELANRVLLHFARELPDGHVHPMPVDHRADSWSPGGGGIVTVARLTPQKRVHLVLEALAALHTLDCDLPLTVVGEGPERPRLERLCADLGLSGRVTFTGALPPSEVRRHLATADLMIFPAEGEGFGLVAAEALMAGVPVVACWDGGGILDIVPGKGAGRLVLPRSEALADASLDILHDPERFAAARAAGERWRTRLAPETVAATCEEWYREALGA